MILVDVFVHFLVDGQVALGVKVLQVVEQVLEHVVVVLVHRLVRVVRQVLHVPVHVAIVLVGQLGVALRAVGLILAARFELHDDLLAHSACLGVLGSGEVLASALTALVVQTGRVEQLHEVDVTARESQLARRLALRTLDVSVRSVFEQALHGLFVVTHGGRGEGRVALVVDYVHVGALVQQEFDYACCV